MPVERARAVAAIEERFLVPTYTSRHAARWIAGHRALAWPLTLRGPVRRYAASLDGGEAQIACVGRAKRFEALLARLGARPLAGEPRELSLRSPGALASLEADLVLVHVHRWTAAAFRREGWYTVPDAVRWHGDTATVPPPRPSRSLASDLRKIERCGYTPDIANGARAWDEFFEEMVLPEAYVRFGPDAWVPSRRLRRVLAARGSVHFALREGVRVAGVGALACPGGLWLPVTGVRGGSSTLVDAGAGSAALMLTLRWALAQGYSRIDGGRTAPFVHDGVARFKRKWGFEPVADPLAHLVAVRTAPACTPLAAFFGREPVFHETDGGLAVLGPADAAG
jgi:hypothetical protein